MSSYNEVNWRVLLAAMTRIRWDGNVTLLWLRGAVGGVTSPGEGGFASALRGGGGGEWGAAAAAGTYTQDCPHASLPYSSFIL